MNFNEKKFGMIIDIFKNVDDVREKRKEEFLEFYNWCLENFPKSLKLKLNVKNLFVDDEDHASQYDNFAMDFTYEDYAWWKGLDVDASLKPVDEIRDHVFGYALDAIEELGEGMVTKEFVDELKKDLYGRD